MTLDDPVSVCEYVLWPISLKGSVGGLEMHLLHKADRCSTTNWTTGSPSNKRPHRGREMNGSEINGRQGPGKGRFDEEARPCVGS